MKETNQLKVKKNSKVSFFPLISFAITFLCCIFLFYKFESVPFGDRSNLYSDLKAQYAPFLILWKNHILNIDFTDFVSSFTYSSKLGLGKNLMGTLGYYLASPLNILLVFFKDSDISVFVTLLVAIKLSLASSFMCLFLEKRIRIVSGDDFVFSERSKLPIVLGVLYSFSSYAIVFALNIMWLDGYLLLPLLLYVLEIFIFEKRYKGIIPILLLLFISHFYIAYMVGAFSFLYLIIRLFEIKTEKKMNYTGKEMVKLCGRYVFIAVACALIAAVFLIPVALDIFGNADPITLSGDKKHFTMFPILQIFEQFFLGRSGDFNYLVNNTPFVFLSILTTCSVFIYFVSDRFDKRIKMIRLGALIVFFAACYIRVLNIVCHAFDTPNWFMHRFSFVIYPLLLIITLEVLLKITTIRNKDIVISSAIVAAILCMTSILKTVSINDEAFFWSLGFIVMYAGVLCLLKKENWHQQLKDMPKILPAFLAIAVVVECSMINTRLINQSFFIPDLNGEVYAESITRVSELNSHKELNVAGARGEYECNTVGSCIKDALVGQVNLCVNSNGISLFNTSSNKNLARFYKQLGYEVNYNYFLIYYNYIMPSNDAFFSLGSVMSTNQYSMADVISANHVISSEHTMEYGEYGIYYFIYRNSKLLPVVFPVDSAADEFDYYYLESMNNEKNYFSFNENWYNSMFPEAFTESYFNILDDNYIDGPTVTSGESFVKVDDISNMKMYTNIMNELGNENILDSMNVATNYAPTEDGPASVKYELTMPESGELYFNLSVPQICNDFTIVVNGQDFIELGDNYSTVNRIGYFEANEKVVVELRAEKGIAITDTYFAIFNQKAFNEQFDRIDTSAVNVVRFTNGHAEFEVDTSKLDSNSLILSTIPYEDGWTCYIDGKKAEITPYQNALIAVDLDKNNVNDGSQHTIELKFCAPGLKVGGICSIIGIILIVIIALYDKLISNSKSKKSYRKANC
ncbi:MAG: YfhO family protein [Clostridia bacterium]|nr:YfhO family protein [Clostridia bacterium]